MPRPKASVSLLRTSWMTAWWRTSTAMRNARPKASPSSSRSPSRSNSAPGRRRFPPSTCATFSRPRMPANRCCKSMSTTVRTTGKRYINRSRSSAGRSRPTNASRPTRLRVCRFLPISIADRHRPAIEIGKNRQTRSRVGRLAFVGRDLPADDRERLIYLLPVVRTVVDIDLQQRFAGMRGRENVAHVLGGKRRRPGAGLLLLGLRELDGDAFGLAVRIAVDVLHQAVIQEVLRSETEAFGLGILPARRPQIAQCRFALAAVERGDLAKLQPVAFASTGKIVHDASSHRFQRAFATGIRQLEIVDREMRRERDAARLRFRRRGTETGRRSEQAGDENGGGEAKTPGRCHHMRSPFAPARNIGSLLQDRT